MFNNTKKNSFTLYTLLIFSFMNAALRFTSSGSTSVFRILSPFIVFCIFINKSGKFQFEVAVVVIYLIYSIFISYVFLDHVEYQYYLFIIYLLFTYIVIKEIKERDINFHINFFCFIDKITIFILILGFFQTIFRFKFPFIELADYPGANLFFWTENEYCSALACMFVLYSCKSFYNKEKHYWKMILIILMLFMCDAKLSLIGCIILFPFLITFKIQTNSNNKKQLGFSLKLVFIFIFLIISIYIMSLLDINLHFRDYKIGINELVIDSLKSIIKLQPIGHGGSISDRTDAIIYGLRKLKESHFMGIGLGNSVFMLSQSGSTLLTAKSMHNIIAQFICEFGVLSFISLFLIIRRLFANIKKYNGSYIPVMKIIYSISFIFISSQSSIGILSNYMMWTITFYIVLLNPNTQNNTE